MSREKRLTTYINKRSDLFKNLLNDTNSVVCFIDKDDVYNYWVYDVNSFGKAFNSFFIFRIPFISISKKENELIWGERDFFE